MTDGDTSPAEDAKRRVGSGVQAPGLRSRPHLAHHVPAVAGHQAYNLRRRAEIHAGGKRPIQGIHQAGVAHQEPLPFLPRQARRHGENRLAAAEGEVDGGPLVGHAPGQPHGVP